MSDTDPKNDESIPTVRISPKKVDDSWKEEARREKEAAARAASSGASPFAPPAEHARGAAEQAKSGVQPGHAAGAKPATTATGGTAEAGKAGAGKKALSTAEQQQSKIFLNFLAGLAQQALMQLGEIESPFSGQRELDLDGARYTVELMNVLRIRTQGNLVGDEAKMLEETIADLKMRYVELAQELQRQMAAQAAKGGGLGSDGATPGPGFGRRK